MVTYESDEEEDAIHNAKGETGLQHGAGFVDMQRPWTITLTAIVAKGAERKVEAAGAEVGAIRAGNAA